MQTVSSCTLTLKKLDCPDASVTNGQIGKHIIPPRIRFTEKNCRCPGNTSELKLEPKELSESSILFFRGVLSRLWNRFSVDFLPARAYPLWTTRGFFAESAWNFLMEPIRDIACLRRASTILSFESPFMLPHCSRKRDVYYEPLSFEANFGIPKIKEGSNLRVFETRKKRGSKKIGYSVRIHCETIQNKRRLVNASGVFV